MVLLILPQSLVPLFQQWEKRTPTKARPASRAFLIPKTEYEPEQPALAIFLVRMTGAFLIFVPIWTATTCLTETEPQRPETPSIA